jgi:hypothetical protein
MEVITAIGSLLSFPSSLFIHTDGGVSDPSLLI